jgi:peptidoglycan hydrolase CwlO-like protein
MRSLVLTALALATGMILAPFDGRLPFAGMASAQAPSGELDAIKAELNGLRIKVDGLQTSVSKLKDDVRELRSKKPAGTTEVGKFERDIKALEQKLASLTRTYESHSHDYLIEATTSSGQVSSFGQGEIMGSGATPTGRAVIGKPK